MIGSIESVALRQPDVVALEDDTLSLTYRHLVDVGVDLATRLGDLPPGRLGLVAPCRAASVAAEVGIAASGRAVVPLDPLHPIGLSRSALAMTEAVAVVSSPNDEELAHSVADGRPVFLWEPDSSVVATGSVPTIDATAELAVYFTSGSTGTPKGVVHTQRPWVEAGSAFAATGGSGPNEKILLTSPMAFSAAGYVSAFALCGGATLSVYDAPQLGLSGLPEWIRFRNITGLSGVVSGVRAIIAASGGRLPSVRWVMYGGEVVTVADVIGARSLGRSVDTLIIYISTELGLTTLRRIAADETIPAEEPIHSGWACSGRRVSVVARDGALADPGAVGAIEVVGNRVSRYLHQPADSDVGPSTFATADVGRILPDGGLQVLGRSDQVVKIHGFRVDIAGVELQLRELEEVQDVAVVLGRNGRGRDVLVSYVVPALASDVSPLGLRRRLENQMPAYMIPGRVVVTHELPRLSTGKVDRVELTRRAEGASESEQRSAGREPSSATEKLIVDVFATLLGLPTVWADDDFFALGGTSLDVVELLLEMEAKLGAVLPASVLTHRCTPELLATYIESDEAERTSVKLIQGARAGRPPIHLVYDLHGSPFRMRALAAALGADQPVYGFECPLIFGELGAPASIEGLAALHVTDLLAQQPDGPYHLCGYSIGGLVLFEIAAQLHEAGHEVGFLGVIDFGPVFNAGVLPRGDGPKPPGTYPVRAPAARRGVDRVRFHLERLRGRSRFDQLTYVGRNLRIGREVALTAARWDLARRGVVRPSLRSSWSWYRLMDASYRWGIREVDVVIDLFLCDQTAIGNIPVSRRIDYESRTDPTLGWSTWAREVEVHPVLGYHNALVEEPYVGGVGRAVREAFEDRLSGGRQGSTQALAGGLRHQ